MPLNLLVGQLSDRGRAREENEDCFCVLTPPGIAPDISALLAVADGMGGHKAGEIASKFVADKLKQLFSSLRYREWVDYKPEREDYYVLVLKEIIERLNDQLHQMASSREEWQGMGTTATIALITGGKLYLGHVGDSRAYLLANGTLRQLTKDHSWVTEQIEQGAMTPEQAAADPRKNQITRALGVSSLIRVDRIIQDLHLGDTLILCTDGLSNLVSDAEIQHYVQAAPDPQQACQTLVDLANQRGGADNITVVIARAVAKGQVSPAVVAPPPAKAEAERIEGVITRPLGRVAEASVTEPLIQRVLIPIATRFMLAALAGLAATFIAGLVLLLREKVAGVLLAAGVGCFTFWIVVLGFVLHAAWLEWRGVVLKQVNQISRRNKGGQQ